MARKTTNQADGSKDNVKKPDELASQGADAPVMDKPPADESRNVGSDIPAPSDTTNDPSEDASPEPEKMYRIMIPSTETETGDVYLSVNGNSFLIQRDKEVEVSETLKELLDHSVINTVQKRDGKMVPVQIQRYPYRRLD